MLVSMTGFGAGVAENAHTRCEVEVRSVNNRFLKISSRLPDSHAALEPQIEGLLKEQLRRGTVSVTVRLRRLESTGKYRLQPDRLLAYQRQVEEWIGQALPAPSTPEGAQWYTSLLSLPDVVDDASASFNAKDDREVVLGALADAISQLVQMRQTEGQAMGRQIAQCLGRAKEHVALIAQQSPRTVEQYRERLRLRLQEAMAESGLERTVEPDDIIREVALLGERCDITEELARLRSHFEQFDQMLEPTQDDTTVAKTDADSAEGRRLEFLVQELYRETNTIGAKANDAKIARWIVELKADFERIREVVQNVE